MAKKLTASFEGQVFTRKTERVYTHVIIIKHKDDTKWISGSWASSLKLAQKATSQFGVQWETKIIPVDKV